MADCTSDDGPRKPPRHLRLLLAVVEAYGPELTVAQLGDHLGVKRRQVYKLLAAAKEGGWLEVIRLDGYASLYRGVHSSTPLSSRKDLSVNLEGAETDNLPLRHPVAHAREKAMTFKQEAVGAWIEIRTPMFGVRPNNYDLNRVGNFAGKLQSAEAGSDAEILEAVRRAARLRDSDPSWIPRQLQRLQNGQPPEQRQSLAERQSEILKHLR